MAIYFAGQTAGDLLQANFTGNTGSGFQSFSMSSWIYVPASFASFTDEPIAIIHANFRMVATLRVASNGGSPFLSVGNESAAITGPTVNTGQWFHALVSTRATSQTAASVRCYLNGNLATSATIASGSYGGQAAYTMMIGGVSADIGLNSFEGWIEDVRFWTRPLTAMEAVKDYHRGSPSQLALIGWNPCRDTYLLNYSAAGTRSNNQWTSSGTAPTVVVSAQTMMRGYEKTTTRL